MKQFRLFPETPANPIDETAIVVLSGGQDSVTCLGWALKMFTTVHCISFKYGQKHAIELAQAQIVCDALGVSLAVHEIPSLAILGDSALTTGGDVNQKHERHANLPASFVPNRNALFLTIAHAYAQKMGAKHLVTGVCETDYSGYPDCREIFITELQNTLNLGYQTDIQIRTPLMHLNKAQTFQLAEDVGVLQLVIDESHTCYNGDRVHHWDWGSGCGECPACKIRQNGFREYKAGNGGY